MAKSGLEKNKIFVLITIFFLNDEMSILCITFTQPFTLLGDLLAF